MCYIHWHRRPSRADSGVGGHWHFATVTLASASVHWQVGLSRTGDSGIAAGPGAPGASAVSTLSCWRHWRCAQLASESESLRQPERSVQTRKSPIPVPPIPDLAGNRGRESPIPDLAEIGKSPIPDLAGNRESGSRFAGPGISWSGSVRLALGPVFELESTVTVPWLLKLVKVGSTKRHTGTGV
jgi:hypothetical protein